MSGKFNVLTAKRVEALHKAGAPGKVSDGGYLYLEGGRYWRMGFRFAGKEGRLAFGTYPVVSLAGARKLREDARSKLAAGVDPRAAKRAEEAASKHHVAEFATAWLSNQKAKNNKTLEHHARNVERLNLAIGKRQLAEVTRKDLRELLAVPFAVGKHELVRKLHSTLKQLFEAAVIAELIVANPAAGLRAEFKFAARKHHPFLEKASDIGLLWRRLRSYAGSIGTVGPCLRLKLLTIARSAEICGAAWAEFELDCEAPVWRVPADRMKMERPHIVPLSRQAVEELRGLHAATGSSPWVFPGQGSSGVLTGAALARALKVLGYGPGELVVHGFRHTASTYLNGLGRYRDEVELCLAHADSGVRAVYNHAQLLPERRALLQRWADELDRIATLTAEPMRTPTPSSEQRAVAWTTKQR